MRFWKRHLLKGLGAAALLAGCASPPPEGESRPATGAGCSCERKICVCPHCRGPAKRCPCSQIEKPE